MDGPITKQLFVCGLFDCGDSDVLEPEELDDIEFESGENDEEL